jgi:hypothetical protein
MWRSAPDIHPSKKAVESAALNMAGCREYQLADGGC